MRILLNGVAALRPTTGIGQYIENLREQLVALAGEENIETFPGKLARRWLKRVARPATAKTAFSKPKSFFRSRLAGAKKTAEHVGVKLLRTAFWASADRLGCDLYHEPNYIPWPCSMPTVATIHDLSVIHHPEWHPAERVKHYETHFYKGLERSQHLIVDSHAIRREIIATLGVPPERVSTVHLGIRPSFRPLPPDESTPVLADLGLKPGYLLHVGTIEPRKNLLMLMQAYCDLPRELRERHPLVLAGGWGWRNQEIRDFYESKGRLEGVRHCGYLADEQLPALYNGARALVFPSHYEGFGFPPLEMMSCGGAVIASEASSLREILPHDMRLLSPDDQAGWRDAMREMLVDRDWWNLSKQGAAAHAATFTWARCARETWNVYEKAARKKQALAA